MFQLPPWTRLTLLPATAFPSHLLRNVLDYYAGPCSVFIYDENWRQQCTAALRDADFLLLPETFLCCTVTSSELSSSGMLWLVTALGSLPEAVLCPCGCIATSRLEHFWWHGCLVCTACLVPDVLGEEKRSCTGHWLPSRSGLAGFFFFEFSFCYLCFYY